jgi:large subunit ribosomal protein L25
MEQLVLEAEVREGKGKSYARKLRREGLIPAVVYGVDEAVSIQLNPEELHSLLNTKAGSNIVFKLRVSGEKNKERSVIVKDLNYNVMNDSFIHVDLLEIRMDQKITVSIPLLLEGEAIGIKMGGVVSQVLRELEVECLPIDIPEQISLDISEVDIGGVLHVRDVEIPENVSLINDVDEPVMSISVPAEEEAEEEEEEIEGDEEATDDESSEEQEGAEEEKAESDDSEKKENEN